VLVPHQSPQAERTGSRGKSDLNSNRLAGFQFTRQHRGHSSGAQVLRPAGHGVGNPRTKYGHIQRSLHGEAQGSAARGLIPVAGLRLLHHLAFIIVDCTRAIKTFSIGF
jgi:hypothetical protein